MRRALIVGVNHYEFGPLNAPIKDAEAMAEMLSTNEDDNNPQNFECDLIISGTNDPPKTEITGTITKTTGEITKGLLRSKISQHFKDDTDTVEMALFYFAGHGYESDFGGYLVTMDAEKYDEGIPMCDIINAANKSKIKEIVIILDCCHADHLGSVEGNNGIQVTLRKGVSILTSSSAGQPSLEKDGHGLFTSILCDALSGGAADVVGNITVASLYNYADKMLGAMDQRPFFKSYISKMTRLRRSKAKLTIAFLQKLTEYFSSNDIEFPLAPSYEPTEEPRNEEHERIFGRLQKFTGAGLVEPVGEAHMYYAAMNSKSCRLTPVGQFYWHLVDKGRLNRLN